MANNTPPKKITDYGARGDGLADDREAIQRALDARPGHVMFPPGHYKIGGTLRIHAHTHLSLAPQATLALADGAARTANDYLLTNANHATNPATATADADADTGITIEGGIWDGNNTGNPRPPGLFDAGYSGAMLHFCNVTGLCLRDLHLRDAEAYHLRLTRARDFHIETIRFSSTRVRPNNDGVHLGGHCEDGVIRDIKGLHPGVTGDDMVALNADDALTRTEVNGMTCGPIRNIHIEDIEAEGCHSFVRLLSVRSPVENITLRNVRGTCEVAAINCDAARGCRVPLFDEAAPPFPDGVGLLRNIDASDLLVAKSANNPIALLRFETRMENVRLRHFRRDLSRDQAPGQPTLRLRHVALREFRQTATGAGRAVLFGECVESAATDIPDLFINPQ
ncbi:MAG: endopolygalacturonase [Opitutaceae bacterium]|jgi:polygalacturonase|nr:endopolygalacturonase [Opitutaceae bacterium]